MRKNVSKGLHRTIKTCFKQFIEWIRDESFYIYASDNAKFSLNDSVIRDKKILRDSKDGIVIDQYSLFKFSLDSSVRDVRLLESAK